MKITHHLSEELLLDYSSGALSEAWSIAVAAHLSKCSHCRALHAKLEEVGGSLLTDSAPEGLSDDIFENVLDRLDEAGASVGNEVRHNVEWASRYGIPAVVTDYLAADTKKIAMEKSRFGSKSGCLGDKR